MQVLLQPVDHESRIHLDIETGDGEIKVTGLERPGVKTVTLNERWTVMESPGGH